MPFISQESILEVRRALDIHEVVSGYFPLKRKGANYWACCPFHEEKSASFAIHPEKQIYHCFGCGKGGDVLSFVMEYEKVDYPEAIRLLAAKAGITLKYEGGPAAGPGKDEVYKANEFAAKLFRNLLSASREGEHARTYLAGRGVNDETAETFRIGWSMDSWDYLFRRARAEGFSEKTLLAAGLIIERERGGHYDRFRNRLMFPIADPQGRIIGFGGRTMVKDEEPKYINTPEGPAFSKGRNLFGLNLVKDEASRTKTLYISEGYLDVILPHQAGYRGIVATLGTALTRDHLRVLRRYADKVVLMFDGDAAGRRANERGMDLLLSENADLYVAELPAGHDPADVVVNLGANALRPCLEKPTELFDYMLKTVAERADLSTPGGKTRAVEETLERVAQVPDEVKREFLLQRLAERFALDVATLKRRMTKPEEPDEPATEPEKRPAVETAAATVLAILLQEPGHVATVKSILPAEAYPTERMRRIAAKLYAWEGAAAEFVSVLEDGADRALVAELAMMEVAPPHEDQIHWCLDTLQRNRYQEERRALKNASPEERLRRIEEARKARPDDYGLVPGR